MLRYLGRRIAGLALVLVIVLTLVFFMLRAAPGSPADAYLGMNPTPEKRVAVEHRFGLDQPIWTQYAKFAGNLLHGDLGNSLFSDRPVTEIIGDRLHRHPRTRAARAAVLGRRRAGRRHPRRAPARLLHRRRRPRRQRRRPVDPELLAGPRPGRRVRALRQGSAAVQRLGRVRRRPGRQPAERRAPRVRPRHRLQRGHRPHAARLADRDAPHRLRLVRPRDGDARARHPAPDRAPQRDHPDRHRDRADGRAVHQRDGPGGDRLQRPRDRPIPGPETERISAKAREHGCHIAFGAYVRDPDWPGHVLSVTTLIGPDGEIIAKHWKARNVKGVFRGFELFTTTTYDVLDRYAEMYGPDAVLPVARTGLGNISLSSTQLEPELFRALAMKGAEVFLRTAGGSFSEMDVRASALHNRIYCAIVNNSVLARETNFFEDTGAGGSAVYGPDGQPIAAADSKFEKLILARIPIASFRAAHRQPDIHWDLYRPVFERYRSRFEPNLYTPYQPHDLHDAGRYLNGRSRWS